MAVLEDLKVKTGELLDEGLRTGALTAEEHSWRTGHLARAETLEALESLVEDLLLPVAPASRPVSSQSSSPGRAVVERSSASQLTIMASRTFTPLDLGRRSELVTIMGSSKVELKTLSPDQALTLEVVTIMGDMVIEVPEGVKVRVECTPIMGDCHVSPQLQGSDPLVRITGAVIMGSLRVVPVRR